MIVLHRRATDEFADQIEQQFLELVISYRKKVYTDQEKPEYPLPYINESGKLIRDEEIEPYLIGLEKELHWQRSITSDACYMDPDTGEIC